MEAEEWGRRIRAFRKLKGFTQAELAESLGISLSILGEIERENRIPNKMIIEQIAQILGITVDELIKFND